MATLWTFLDRHVSPEISRIHPEILAQKVVSSSGRRTIFQRTIEVQDKRFSSTWRITIERPRAMRWEIVEGDGPWAPGTWLDNSYTESHEKVKVRSVGELELVGVPSALQTKIIRTVLDQVSAQDRTYLHVPG